MKTYNCKVRLAGNVANEVGKEAISAAEIEILRFLHGSDAVADIVEVGNNDRDSMKERAYLRAKYASPELFNSEQGKQKAAMFRDLFGHERLPLPDDLADVETQMEPEDPVEEVAAAPVKRTKVPKPTVEAALA